MTRRQWAVVFAVGTAGAAILALFGVPVWLTAWAGFTVGLICGELDR